MVYINLQSIPNLSLWSAPKETDFLVMRNTSFNGVNDNIQLQQHKVDLPMATSFALFSLTKYQFLYRRYNWCVSLLEKINDNRSRSRLRA